MAVVLDGTLGVTTPAESVTGTGVWSVGGSQIYKDASGNVGIGTGSPAAKLHINSPSLGDSFRVTDGVSTMYFSPNGGGDGIIKLDGAYPLRFLVNSAERARIDSSGNLLVGVNSTFDSARLQVAVSATNSCISTKPATNVNYDALTFRNSSGTYVGYIGVTNTTTSYVTSSDYRLKNTIAPMTGALAKVALLKPVTYKWNADGSDGQGFIAHELAEVEPGCVSGAKDAVDAEGKPQYQGIDTSFLVATLTAAIQELKAIIDTQATRIQALEAK
jgi:hypothetical protein